ncbi:MAG: threonine/serine exporter family protein [Proteobacteria bacterium]|nr:threonine/serine exporter family protein [Pseudomonadota bacterium]MBS0230008.1 threonine/serine exporter family protein [Pseudomonadota bacterium]
MTTAETPDATYAERIAFIEELAWHLHAYGTTAQRMEGAIELVAKRLLVECEPWSNPTGIILSFRDPSRPGRHTEITRIVRPGLGDTNLRRLCAADRIAEDVISGKLDIPAGRAALQALERPASSRALAVLVLGFALASAAVAGLLRLPWLEIGVAGTTGLGIGLLLLAAQSRKRLHEGFEALSGLLAGSVAILVSAWLAPLNLNTVIIASLIVLVPGMTLALAASELASRHLVSGTARFAGAAMTVVNLTIGTAIALAVAGFFGIEPRVHALRPQPDWVAWSALALAAYAFAVLFQAQRRDYPLVMLSAVCGYLVSRYGGEWLGSGAGVFLGAFVTTAASNAYARMTNRPGALVRLPGIIMLVPGSVALRGVVSLVQSQDFGAGQAAAMAVFSTLMALVAGLVFGNLLVSARRNL